MMTLPQILQLYTGAFHPVVPFDPSKDRLYPFDFTSGNRELLPEKMADIDTLAQYIRSTLERSGCRYGFGGYGEHRTLYARSTHFDGNSTQVDRAGNHIPSETNPATSSHAPSEPRRLHLGIDIWGPAGTPVQAPLDGIVHSFAFNDRDGDYGATLILTHSLAGSGFHTLYGHLSLNSLKNRVQGARVRAGEVIGEFGMRFENGNWPPHLHFQLIRDLQGMEGDYPGVCRFSEKEKWMDNCPDPDWVLQMGKFIDGQVS